MTSQLSLPSPILEAISLIAIASAEAFPPEASPAEETDISPSRDSELQLTLPGVLS